MVVVVVVAAAVVVVVVVVVVAAAVITLKLSVYYSAVLSSYMNTLRPVGCLVNKELKKM